MKRQRYQVLVEHLARIGRPFPRVFFRVHINAKDASAAVAVACQRGDVGALGDLLVSLTVSPCGSGGVKS